jgi:hypothetical protein
MDLSKLVTEPLRTDEEFVLSKLLCEKCGKSVSSMIVAVHKQPGIRQESG